MRKFLIIPVIAVIALAAITPAFAAQPILSFHIKSPRNNSVIGDTINFDFTIADRSTAGQATGNILIDGVQITDYSCGAQPGLSFDCHVIWSTYQPQITTGKHIITINYLDTLGNALTENINVTK